MKTIMKTILIAINAAILFFLMGVNVLLMKNNPMVAGIDYSQSSEEYTEESK